jgi:hypothetical protein
VVADADDADADDMALAAVSICRKSERLRNFNGRAMILPPSLGRCVP